MPAKSIAVVSSFSSDDVSITDMCSEDLTQVTHIEQLAHISPWARLSFEESLNKEYCCRVLKVGDHIQGYHVCSAVLDELHILNVVCAPKQQGRGFGHALMSDIRTFAEQKQLKKIFLEVRASNTVAQSLYEKWGFKQIALRKKYYKPSPKNHEREDALVYLCEVG